MGLGGVWLGEILKNKEKVGELLEAGENLELMAVVTLGHPDENSLRSATGDGSGRRDRLEEMVFLRK
jgi:nitroreductase